MRLEHVRFLRCPLTGDELECLVGKMDGEHVMSGSLVSQSGPAYPIENGVPDFRPEEISKRQRASENSFGEEWQVFNREGWDSRVKNERIHFYNYTRLIPSFLYKKTILDAGCGNGRYINIASLSNPEMLIGMDISAACHVAFANTKDFANVLILRGDIFNPPFAGKCFDVLYSIGVLHHTPSAREAFVSLTRFCKPGGIISLYLYGRGNPVLCFFNNLLRNHLFSRLPGRLTAAIVWPVSLLVEIMRRIPVLGPFVLSVSNRVVYIGTYHNMYDAYTAGYTSFHSPEEVEGWYHQAGFSCHVDVRQNRTALYCSGQKVTEVGAIEPQRMRVSAFKEILYALFT